MFGQLHIFSRLGLLWPHCSGVEHSLENDIRVRCRSPKERGPRKQIVATVTATAAIAVFPASKPPNVRQWEGRGGEDGNNQDIKEHTRSRSPSHFPRTPTTNNRTPPPPLPPTKAIRAWCNACLPGRSVKPRRAPCGVGRAAKFDGGTTTTTQEDKDTRPRASLVAPHHRQAVKPLHINSHLCRGRGTVHTAVVPTFPEGCHLRSS